MPWLRTRLSVLARDDNDGDDDDDDDDDDDLFNVEDGGSVCTIF